MKIEMVAIIIQEGTRFLSEIIKSRPPKRPEIKEPETVSTIEVAEVVKEEKVAGGEDQKIESGTACLPCVNSHMHACVGLLNEASRFSKKEGISDEVIKRTDGCLGEIVAAERIDLAPENIVNLSSEEKKIANYASKELREIRHDLEGLSKPDELEQIAARTAKLQHYVGKEWFKYRLSKMSEGEKRELAQKAAEKALGTSKE